MKLVKMFYDHAIVVECSNSGGTGIEYDPFYPEKTWEATVQLINADEIVISAGGYCLHAVRRYHDSNIFSGLETSTSSQTDAVVYMYPDDCKSVAKLNTGTIKLAKIAENLSRIVECDIKTGIGTEYEPFGPDKSHGVNVQWQTSSEIVIRTEGYHLIAWRVYDLDGFDYFQGIEMGPYPAKKFNVYLISPVSCQLPDLSLSD